MPNATPRSSAQRRHGSPTEQRWHTCLARSTWSSAGPAAPIGKNNGIRHSLQWAAIRDDILPPAG
jgi:hypothetical protein